MIIKKNNTDISELIRYLFIEKRSFYDMYKSENCRIVILKLSAQGNRESQELAEFITLGLENPLMVDDIYMDMLKEKFLRYSFYKNYLLEGVLIILTITMSILSITELALVNVLFGMIFIVFGAFVCNGRYDKLRYNKLLSILS